MKISLKNIQQNQPQIKESSNIHIEIALIGLKGILEGIAKRIQCQVFAKLIANTYKQNEIANKIKIIQYFSQRFMRENQQNAFNRLKNIGHHHFVKIKGVNSLCLIMKRVVKDNISFAFQCLKDNKDNGIISQIRENKTSRQSIRSGRFSESSNLLSISQESVFHSRSFGLIQSRQGTKEELLSLSQENEQLKRMILSEEMRESLLKMQRFDRYLYNISSEKTLKQPIINELKRLEKMKNETKEMRAKFYDNELTVTCLFNHVKLVAQMNRQLTDFNALKIKITDLEKKMAQQGTQHRKQISEYKKKLLFLDTGKAKNPTKETSIQSSTQIDISQYQFSNEEQTTYSILIVALRNKQYGDAKREIEHFLKKSKKEKFTTIIKEIFPLVNDLLGASEHQKVSQNSKREILNNLNQFDKYLRMEKFQDCQKLKNKSVLQLPMQVHQLFESVLTLFSEIKRYRKKESNSAEKSVKSDSQKNKKNNEGESEQLRMEMKKLKIHIEELENEKKKLEENLKKIERPRLSLPPRRPSNEKELQGVQLRTDAYKKLQQNQVKLQKQVEQTNKQLQILNQKYLNQIKTIITFFSDKTLKRKASLQLKQDSQVNKSFNLLIKMIENIHQQKDQQIEQNYESKRLNTNLNDQNKRIQEQLKKLQFEKNKMQTELMKVKQQIARNKYIIPKMSEEIILLKNQISSFENNLNTSEQENQSLQIENDRLRQELQILKNRIVQPSPHEYLSPIMQLSQSKSSTSKNQEYMQKAKELQDFTKYYEQIKSKKHRNLPYQQELNELRMDFPDSLLVEILEQSLESQTNFKMFTNNIKHIISLFSEDEWRRKSNIFFQEQGETYTYINQIIEILINLSLEKDDKQKLLNEMKQMRIKQENLNNQIAKVRQELQSQRRKFISSHAEYEGTNNQLKERINQLQLFLSNTNDQISKDQKQLFSQSHETTSQSLELVQAASTIHQLTEELDNTKAQLILLKRRSSNPKKEQLKIERSNSNNKNQEGKLIEYQNKLAACEEKLSNYKLLFQKIKMDRDNLKLLLEEKNEEYEICKQNQQKFEDEIKQYHTKIEELKQKINATQTQFKRLEHDTSKFILEKQALVLQWQARQAYMNDVIQSQHLQIQKLNHFLQEHAQRINFQHSEIEQIKRKAELDLSHLEQQRKYLVKSLQNAQQENNRVRLIFQEEIQEYRKKCQRYNLEINEYKENFELERQLLRQKINQLSRITQSASTGQALEDHQKQELRRQIDLINTQLAKNIRHNQNQLRESRRYIQQLMSQVQSKDTFHNEEKRILREEIQRARNEEYQINQDKIRSLRQDIQSLRQQNERLTEIIDSNQAPFKQIVQEHRQMYQNVLELQQVNSLLQRENAQLSEENNRLGHGIEMSENQKQSLLLQLERLQQKLADFQTRVVSVINQCQLKEEAALRNNQTKLAQLQSVIKNLNEENANINLKNSEQARELIQIQQKIIRQQFQLNSHRQLQRSHHEVPKQKNSEYSKYLQQRIQLKDIEIKRYLEKEYGLMKKLQDLIQIVNGLQIEKHHILSQAREQELRMNAIIANTQTEFLSVNGKFLEMQSIIEFKDKEIFSLKNDYVDKDVKTGLQQRIREVQAEKYKIMLENNRLILIIQEHNRNKVFFEKKLEENQNIFLQNKRLINKITMIQEESKLLSHKYLESQAYILSLQNKLLQNKSNYVMMTPELSCLSSIHQNVKKELIWYKEQQKLKDQQILKLRGKQLQFQAEIERYSNFIAQLQSKQQKFYRETKLLQESKIKIRNMEQSINNHHYTRQKLEEKYKSQLNQKDQQNNALREIIQQLNEKVVNAEKKVTSTKKYENEYLLEIAKQLDENYQIKGEEQMIEITLLQKINTEIGELININNCFKQKCDFLQREGYQLSKEEVQLHVSVSIRKMLVDLFAFLGSNQLINPQQIPSPLQGINLEMIILDLGSLLKNLFSSIFKSNEDEIIKYNNIIRNIRAMIEQACLSKDLQCLNRLRLLLVQAD